jgi:hypothetical protein
LTYGLDLVRAVPSRLTRFVLFGALIVPLLLAGAMLVHTHDAPGIGLYNQEHDLVLMGVFGSVAPLPVLVLPVALVAIAMLVVAPPVAVDSSTRRLEVSRAPPTA